MYILTQYGMCFQAAVPVKNAKHGAKKACRNQICFEFDESEAKTLRTLQIHMYRNLNDCV